MTRTIGTNYGITAGVSLKAHRFLCDERRHEVRTERMLVLASSGGAPPPFLSRCERKFVCYLTYGQSRESRANRDSNVPSRSEVGRIQTSFRSRRGRKLGATATGMK